MLQGLVVKAISLVRRNDSRFTTIRSELDSADEKRSRLNTKLAEFVDESQPSDAAEQDALLTLIDEIISHYDVVETHAEDMSYDLVASAQTANSLEHASDIAARKITELKYIRALVEQGPSAVRASVEDVRQLTD